MAVAQYPKTTNPLSEPVATAQGREVAAQPTRMLTTDARISLRAVTVLEVVSVLGSILIAVWGLVPIYPQQRWPLMVPAFLAVWLVVNSQRVRGESWKLVGFRQRNFFDAMRLLTVPMLLAIAMMSAIGWKLQSFQLSTHFAIKLVAVPAWGLLQQFITQGFLYRRVRYLLVNQQTSREEQAAKIRLAIFVSAGCFALVHMPNLTLTLLTLAAGLLWSWVYERAPNLWALGLSHGVLSLVLMHTMPSWLLPSMSIGFKHFLYQKF